MLYTKKDEKINRVFVAVGSVIFAAFLLFFDWSGWILDNKDQNVVFSTEANLIMADPVKNGFTNANNSGGCNSGMCRLR